MRRRPRSSTRDPSAPLESFFKEPLEHLPRWVDALPLLMTGILMLLWTWGTWPDPVIDFGAQLYFAWQLAEGKVLYADLAHYKGPLSPYMNALWFQFFGTSLRTLMLANLVITAVLVWLLYRLFSTIAGRFSATVSCLVFIMVFAFGQLVGIGNYNFVCPYSHEVTHGLVLSLAMIGSLARGLYHRHRNALVGAGVLFGLVFLTDPAVFLAAGSAAATGLVLSAWVERDPPHRRAL